MKSKNILKILAQLVFVVLIVTLVAIGLYDMKGKNKIISSFEDIKTGLDISGGVSVVYQPDTEGQISEEDMSKAMTIMRKRLDNKNLFDANVKADLANKWLEVEIPDETDPEKAIEGLGQTAKLEFRDSEGNVILDGGNVISAKEEQNQSELGAYQEVVALQFNEEGRRKFAEATTNLVGQPIYIYLDETQISAPVVNEPITDGNAVISMGNSNSDKAKQEATELAGLIESGSLPFGLKILSNQYVGPTVGAKALEISIYAAIIGIALVILYMICIYKLPGIVSSVSLLAYIGLTIIVLANMGITLTLSGIAGIILSIGMAVDANIVIFERIKEELNNKRGIQKAIDIGFKNATSAIIDSNITTLIASGALYLFGIGPIKGFGAVLFMGVVISMFTSLVLTRYLLKDIAKIFNKNAKIYGGKVNG